MPDELVSVGSLPAMFEAKDANVTDEVARAGVSFGNIILATGKAVAETQKKLDATGAATATAMSNTLVDVIAVVEKVYDDEGNLTDGVTHVQHLPLITFMNPTLHKVSALRLQCQFYASEFATSSSATNINATFDHSVGINFVGVRGKFAGQLNASQVNTNSSDDLTYASARMNLLLEPRDDIGVPKPTQIIKGPHLAVIQGAKQETHENSDPTKRIISRTMEVLIEYRRRNGDPIPDKALSIDAPGIVWEYAGTNATDPNGHVVTDTDGHIMIQLRRDFPDEEMDTAEKDFVLTTYKGILRNAATISC